MKQKISFSLDWQLVEQIDQMVKRSSFVSRSQLVEYILREKMRSKIQIYQAKAKDHARKLKNYQDLIKIEKEKKE